MTTQCSHHPRPPATAHRRGPRGSRGHAARWLAHRLIPVIALAAAAAVPSPAFAQEVERSPLAAESVEPLPLAVPSLESRIEEARSSHQRNRLLGTGLVAAGATAILGALVDWAERDQLGISPGATGALVGGVTLIAWGGQRHRSAGEAMRRAERWQAQAESAGCRSESCANRRDDRIR